MFLTFQIVLLYLFILIYSPGKQNKRQTKESRFKRPVTPLLTMLLSASEEGNILSFRSRSWTVQHTWWLVRATGAERCRFPQHLKHKTQTVSAAFKGRRLIWRLFTELCLVFPPNNRLISLCLSIRPWMDGFGGGAGFVAVTHERPTHLWSVSLLGHSHWSHKQRVSILCLLAQPPPPHVWWSLLPPAAKLWARGQTLSCVPLVISCPSARLLQEINQQLQRPSLTLGQNWEESS